MEELPGKAPETSDTDLQIPGVDSAELLSMEEVERRYILQVLRRLDGNKSAAAAVLGLNRRTLYRKLERYRQSH